MKIFTFKKARKIDEIEFLAYLNCSLHKRLSTCGVIQIQIPNLKFLHNKTFFNFPSDLQFK